MNIVIISPYSMPYGMAATNRILAYSKGLVSCGHKLTIYNPFPTDKFDSSSKISNEGNHEGVNYIYTSGRYLIRNKYLRVIHRFIGIKRLVGYITSSISISKANYKNKIDFLFISNDSLIDLLFYSFFSKQIGAKSVFIFDEFPFPIKLKLKKKIPIWKNLSYKIILRKLDLYISISEALKKYYTQLCYRKTFTLPVITDTSRFNNEIDKKLSTEEYLCYMGNMQLSKDDVDNIIKAFSIVASEFKKIKLYLYGSPSEKTSKKLNKLINTLKLQDKVFLKGRVSVNQVPKILKQAKILVSSQPNTIRASGGFPTKLGEYLASGTPALFTDVGENSRYVKNGVHLFFSEPENPHVYAEKIRYILSNYGESLKIAKKGKDFIYDNYSHITQGKKLIDFLNKNRKS